LKTITPLFLRRISNQPSFSKILDNIGWLFLDKALRMIVGLFVGVWVARYLGPEKFGQLNYAVAFVSLFGAIASMGLNSIVVRDIVRDPENTHATLGAAFILQLIGGIVALTASVLTITWFRPEDSLTKSMVAILGFSLVFKSSEVIKYWFESQVQSRYTVWIENGILVIVASIKVVMILIRAPIIAFVYIILLEAGLVATGLFGIYLKRGMEVGKWSVRFDRIISLFKDSIPLILMSILLSVYTKIDLLMVEYFLGWDATGLYTAAVKIAESWFFLAVIFVQSLYPSFIKSEQFDKDGLKHILTLFYSFMFWFSCIVSFILYIASDTLIVILYGLQYIDAVPVFKLYVWSGVFVFVITSSSRWFLLKNRTSSLLYRSCLGAISNVALNYFFIRKFGLVGASLSTLISYFIVAYIYDIFDYEARKNLIIKFYSIYYPIKWLLKRSI
jgi:O-antigen/teichoic acid export membrane protein